MNHGHGFGVRQRVQGTHGGRILADSTRHTKLESALRVACLAGALASSLACAPAADSVESPPPRTGESADMPRPQSSRPPDDVWLTRLGVGSSQTARVCARGSGDRVATALCASDVNLRGLSDLHSALGLG